MRTEDVAVLETECGLLSRAAETDLYDMRPDCTLLDQSIHKSQSDCLTKNAKYKLE
jgi:hypothetical protein